MKFSDLLFLLVFVNPLFAARRPGATFLLIPPTAKATGMAYAWSAIADDASANYYNGAGLAFLQSPCLTLSYFDYLPGLHPDMHYVYFAGAYPFASSGLGFDIIWHTVGKIEKIIDDIYMGTVTGYDFSPKITYSRKFKNSNSLGIGLKVVYANYWINPWVLPYYNWSPSLSYAFDFDCLFLVKPNLSLATVLHNFGPDITYTESGAKDPLPCLFRIGVACKLIEFDNFLITVSAEITKILTSMFADESATLFENLKYEIKEAWKGIGAEFKVYRAAEFVIGYFYDYEGNKKGITFGGGIKFKKFEFDIGIDENVFDFETQNRKISLIYHYYR
ncbi:MAG: PorV/PorQ family protein [bacterium]